MLGTLSNLTEVRSCHKAALPIDRAVPRPSRSRCDAKLSGKRTLGVSRSGPPGDKGHIDM